MGDEGLRRPRRKPKSGLHLLESPFPIPIETITGKEAIDTRWYYYFGTLQENCVAISRLGDLTFLYRLGFFGKGMLSKSRPQFEKYADVLSEHSRKQYSYRLSMLEPESRKRQLKKYDLITRERLRQHETWSIIKARLEATKGKLPKKVVNKNTEEESKLDQCEDLHTFVDDGLVEECSTDGEEGDIDEQDKCLDERNKFLDEQDKCLDERDKLLDEQEKCLDEKDITTNDAVGNSEVKDEGHEKGGENTLKRSLSLEDLGEEPDKFLKMDDPYKLYECLTLTFEEAFFLSYGLGCLGVTMENYSQLMNLNEMWHTFCDRKERFVELYIAYHYFRSKGWVVRFANIYGADLALYKDGMPFFHASYSVYVNMVYAEDLSLVKSTSNNLPWCNYGSMSRVNEKVAKEVLLCYVIRPKDFDERDISCISKCRVMEVVMRRWIPEKHREIKSNVKK